MQPVQDVNNCNGNGLLRTQLPLWLQTLQRQVHRLAERGMNFSSKPGLLGKSRGSQLGRVLPPGGIFDNVWRHF